MLGKLHFVTSTLFFTPLAIVFFLAGFGTPALMILFMAGLLLGVLLPDADHPAARGINFVTIPAMLATKTLVLLPLAGFMKLKGIERPGEHRAVLHSVWGALAAGVFWSVLAALLSLPFLLSPIYPTAFGAGILCGFLFHLFQDSLTASGIKWFYPNGLVVKGRISMQYAGLREKRFIDSESYAGLLFVIAAIANSFLAVIGVAPAVLAITAAFMLLLIAAACRMETVAY